MKNVLKNMSLKGKFLFLTTIITIAFIFMICTFFVSQANLNRGKEKIEHLDQFSTDLSNVRVSVNAMRGEILFSLLTNSRNMAKELAESEKAYYQHRQNLDTLITSLLAAKKEWSDTDLDHSLTETESKINALTDLTDSHMKALKRSDQIIDDSLNQVMASTALIDYIPQFMEFRYAINTAYKAVSDLRASIVQDYRKTEHRTEQLLIGCFLLATVVVGLFSYYVANIILNPILTTKETLEKISKGDIPSIVADPQKDETGAMISSLKILVSNLQNLKVFTTEVGKGNFETKVELFGNSGAIAEALLSMKENLKVVALKEGQEKWTSEGLAETGKLLRVKYDDASSLYDALVRFVVKYVGATQGSLFVAEGSNSDDQHVKLAACYAYDRKKYLNHTIAFGEGLVGQACLEKEPIYMTAIPKNYLKITSGLGEATPNSLFILPLINNESVQGVLEIASFDKFAPHQMKFLKQFGDLLGADIAREEFNSRMKNLLEASQQQTEELRATEEELRQSMEELSATQEEMERRMREVTMKREVA